MNTPNSDFVLATINRKPLRIDLLNGVLGVTRRELEEGVAIIEAAAEVKGHEFRAQIAVLQCSAGETASLGRSSMRRSRSFASLLPTPWRPETGLRQKTACRMFFEYLRSDKLGLFVSSMEAARRLDVTQPSLCSPVRDLERELRRSLYRRIAQASRPTRTAPRYEWIMATRIARNGMIIVRWHRCCKRRG
jgi:hypothetical protein